jgi:hypothetical protein
MMSSVTTKRHCILSSALVQLPGFAHLEPGGSTRLSAFSRAGEVK